MNDYDIIRMLSGRSVRFDPEDGALEGAPETVRRLSDLRGIFADRAAFEEALADDNPVIYRVRSIENANGEGDLHYGLGILMPGRIGDEFYMTRGHLHAWRPAAEVYIGLRGSGVMLLEHEESGTGSALPLEAGTIVYVPGSTAHRTINTGDEPLTYIGVFPARAGHDYGAMAARNFRNVVVARDGRAEMMVRTDFLKGLKL